MVGGFFPTPYPDECYYSILCRYFVRSVSTSYKRTVKSLFRNMQCLSSTIFFPARLECVDNWAHPASLITRKNIALNHTMYPYMAMMYSPEFRAEMECVMNGGTPAFALERIGETKSLPLWPKHLKYCTECVREDKILYGETYWHRAHQLQGVLYCTKHHVRLLNSSIPVSKTTTSFHAASDQNLPEIADSNSHDGLFRYKEKFLRIGKESEWLLSHGAAIDWDFDFQAKYKRILREKDIVTIQGVADYGLIFTHFNDYWGQDFLEALYSAMSDTRDWIQHIQAARLLTWRPIYHILLMCFLKGSVKAFLAYEPPETPFGAGPWPCENPICKHYHVDGCRNTEIRYINGVATGFFECKVCGMVYKQVKRKGKTGDNIIVDYGNVWERELLRCLGDEKMTIPETAALLKCAPHIVGWQKKKMGLCKKNAYTTAPRRYDAETDGEAFYKAQVMEIFEQYQEVTFSMLRQLAPGAYSYLSKHDVVWLRNHLIHESARADSRELDRQLLSQVQNAVDWIKKNGDSNRQLTYGYIASVAGAKEHELKYAQLKRPLTKAFLDTVIESREDWIRRRIIAIWQSKQEGKLLSLSDLKREMSIKPNTYVKYKNLIEQLINELNLELL